MVGRTQGVTCVGPDFPKTGESGDHLEGFQRTVNDLFGRVNYPLRSSIRDEPNHSCVINVLEGGGCETGGMGSLKPSKKGAEVLCEFEVAVMEFGGLWLT